MAMTRWQQNKAQKEQDVQSQWERNLRMIQAAQNASPETMIGYALGRLLNNYIGNRLDKNAEKELGVEQAPVMDPTQSNYEADNSATGSWSKALSDSMARQNVEDDPYSIPDKRSFYDYVRFKGSQPY